MSARRAWLLWTLACAAVFVVHLATLDLHARVNRDEVQILEFGRTFFEPRTDWGMNWNIQESVPALGLPYPFAAVQELSYRLTAPSHLGPRLVALIGAVIAASLAFGWLRARGSPPWVALTVALLFLTNPIFTSTFREGRVDGWAFAAIFAACWLLNGRSAPRRRMALAGGLCALAPFTWPTSLALAPLVLLELIRYLRAGRSPPVSSLAWLAIGGFMAAMLLSLPILLHWENYRLALASASAIQSHAAAVQRSLVDMYALYDPLLIPLVALAFAIRRDWALLLMTCLALLMMYQTMMYPKRIMYLLPYFLAVIAGAWAWLQGREGVERRRVAAAALLSLALAYNLVFALVRPTVIALHEREARSVQAMTTALEAALGPGPLRVLLEEWDSYYAARALGWRIYKAGSPIRMDSETYREFLHSMDYVLLRETWMYKVRPTRLLKEGFEPAGRISFPQAGEGDARWMGLSFRRRDAVYEDILVFRNPQYDPRTGKSGN